MLPVVLVFIGAGFGGTLRYGVSLLAARLVGTAFPYGTLTINIIGSAVMGIVAGFFAFRSGAPGMANWQLFVATGILGGFTTFSSFSLDVAVLWERGAELAACSYVLASVFVSVFALFAGLWLVRTVLQ